MTIFPEGFDPRSEILFSVALAEIETPDGAFGFIIAADGRFTDVNGRVWHGSQLIQVGDNEYSTSGKAPTGQIGMSFFQDPGAPDLIMQVRELGAEYIDGRSIRFYIQPFRSQAEMMAPALAPILVMTRTMRKVITSAEGGQRRVLAISYESAEETRKQSSRLIWNASDHSRLIGATNPSLTFVPQVYDNTEPLF